MAEFIFIAITIIGTGMLFFFWLYMLLGAIYIEVGANKIAWVIVILSLNLFGAFLYLMYRAFFHTPKRARQPTANHTGGSRSIRVSR